MGAVINAVNQAGLSLPSKLDSRYNNGYIDNLTIIVQVDKDKMTGAFGSRKADWGDSNTLLGGQWKVGAYNVLPTNMLGVGTLTDRVLFNAYFRRVLRNSAYPAKVLVIGTVCDRS